MKIRFTKPYHVLDGTGTNYKEGDELICTSESAQHFIRRGVAVEAPREVAKKATVRRRTTKVTEKKEPAE